MRIITRDSMCLVAEDRVFTGDTLLIGGTGRTDLPTGDLNMVRYAEMLVNIGYPQRYCQTMGTKTAPLVVEAESAYRDLEATSANGIQYVRDNLCFPLAAGSFEEGMGA